MWRSIARTSNQTENALRFDKTGRKRTKTFSELIKKTGEKYIENTKNIFILRYNK